MGHKKKTWEEKLEDKEGYPKVLKLEEGFPCYKALHKMGVEAGEDVVLVNPSEVVQLMRLVPYGKVTTLADICQKIAREHGVKGCCTLTSGIFVMTAANAVADAAKEGRDIGVPYWRTLKIGGYLNEKYPGGMGQHRCLLEEEGHRITGKGNKLKVEDLEDHLFRF
jgi:hypothetical protein